VKYVDEYRDRDRAAEYREAIARLVTRPWAVMEVCGGQTHAIARFGIEDLLPPEVTLLHGPGCPVCVTPIEQIDRAIAVASRPGVIFCSYGDMLRVPGSSRDLLRVKAAGGDVRVVTSAMDALLLARRHPDRQVVFFAIGFETTAPGHALAVSEAARLGVPNFSVLVSHVRVPPAMVHLLSAPERRVDGFLAAGHVCTIMGTEEYGPIAARHHVPIVVTGFEPLDILQGLHMVLAQLEAGRAEVENQYARAVRADGNPHARAAVERVFEVTPRAFRGIGVIPESGLRLRSEYSQFDAEARFEVESVTATEPPECQAGRVLLGLLKPTDCPEMGKRCTPDTPLGATMVSSEGACAAYYRYRRTK
jgi:hydrogenase expression/formation protein HypD